MCCSLFLAKAQTHWTPVTGIETTMSVTGIIIIDGVEQTSTQLEIGAFCGNECRGAKKAGFFPPTSQYTVPISIAGLTGDLITFRIYDHSLGEELDLECENTITFEVNAVIGTIGNWFEFSFTTPLPPAFHFVVDGNWSDESNWQGGALPSSTDAVSIDADCILDITAEVTDLTVSDGFSMTIQSGKILTVSGNLINADVDGIIMEDGSQLLNESDNVKASYQKDIDAYTSKDSDGWYLISSPVDEMPIAGSSFITEVFDLYRYKESTSVWENYRAGHDDFTYFENGRGYLFANSNTFLPAFKGDLNNYDVVFPVTCEAQNTLAGFNILGNPYPHVIYKGAGGAIDDVRLAAGYYYLSFKGEWLARTFETAIQPGQGVLVRTIANADIAIEKTNAEAIAESSSKDDMKRLKINVVGNGKEDCAFAYLCNGNGLNKVGHRNETVPLLYIPHDGSDYAIAMLGDDIQTFNLDFEAKTVGMYTLSVETLGNFDYLHIIDKFTGADVDMLVEDNYSFVASPTDSESRFMIVLRDYSGVGETPTMSDFAYTANGAIIVNGEGTLQLIDMMGRVVKTQEISGVETICTSTSGVYVVRIICGKDVKTQKIVVR